jgi:septal ring factor EnvC (AmiA/AmiB activator)
MRLAVLLLFYCSTLLAAENQESLMSRLEKIRAKMSRDRELLFTLESRAESIRKSIEKNNQDILESKRRASLLGRSLTDNASAREEVVKERAITAGKISEVHRKAQDRLRAIFYKEKLNRDFQITEIVESEALSKNLFLLKKLHDFDKQLLAALSELQRRLISQDKELEGLTHENRKLLAKLESERRLLEVKSKRQVSLLAEVDRKEKRLKATLTSLNTESETLSAIIDEMITEPSISPETEESELFEISNASSEVGLSGYYQGEAKGNGLEKINIWPVDGKVTASFGEQRIGFYREKVFQRGIEITPSLTSSSVEIKSIDDGIIRFIGSLPGFGRVIVVDHGKRDYSLYGHIGVPLVKLGDEVTVATPIANLASRKGAESSKESATLYLEVRTLGKAVNPLTVMPAANTVKELS